jgi:hypothetical protein
MKRYALISENGQVQNVIISESENLTVGMSLVEITDDTLPVDNRWKLIDGVFVAPPREYPAEFLAEIAREEERTGKKIQYE